MGETQSAWVSRPPSSPLAPYVDRYVGYRMVGFEPGLHRGVPSRHMTFIVSIGPDIDVIAQSDATQSPQRYRAVMSGLATSPAMISHPGDQEGVAIELNPLGFRALFGMPSRALWNTSTELADVAGSLGDELWERLQLADSWDDRLAVCDRVLTRLFVGAEVTPELRRAWQVIVQGTRAAEDVAVESLAADIGWSRQHLTRRFKEEFGLTPQRAGRIVRFERARDMLMAVPSYISIAQVAATCGYYDQAHLTRDFVAFAGCPPGRYLAEEDLPSFQDVHDDDLPGLGV